jgi:hypothetical protein
MAMGFDEHQLMVLEILLSHGFSNAIRYHYVSTAFLGQQGLSYGSISGHGPSTMPFGLQIMSLDTNLSS